MSDIGSPKQPDEAMVDLLIKQVTEGLSAAEQRELDVLDSALAAEYREDFERAVAAISLAGTPTNAPSAALVASLEQQAVAHFATGQTAQSTPESQSNGSVSSPERAARNIVNLRDRATQAASTTPAVLSAAMRNPSSGRAGWFAAAACLLLALFGWLRSPSPATPPVADVLKGSPPSIAPPSVMPTPPVPPTPAEERTALLAREGTLKVTLGATKDAAAKGVSGDVVWDPVTQRGFVHFAGLAANDPHVSQYQAWIFDGQRDKKYPVDGGVFDIPAGTPEVVIPIRASLFIGTAKAFAVTVEKPGGVVVSGLAHVVVLGAAG